MTSFLHIRLTDGQEIKTKVPVGANLRAVLLEAGVSLYSGVYRQLNCGGLGICGSCKVKVKEGETWWERRACQIRCFQPLEIEVRY